eukprot:2668279-Prymnesium_polylepis.1
MAALAIASRQTSIAYYQAQAQAALARVNQARDVRCRHDRPQGSRYAHLGIKSPPHGGIAGF